MNSLFGRAVSYETCPQCGGEGKVVTNPCRRCNGTGLERRRETVRVKIPAGWLIEQCGWKGRSLGRAGVHSRQALVLVNRGGATGQEVLTLCNAVKDDVKNRFGIDIYSEVNII